MSIDPSVRQALALHGVLRASINLREFRHAHIVRAPTSPTVVQTFLDRQLDVAAGVRQQLEADASGNAGLRLLPGRFMVIRQAMGTPKTRGEAAALLLGSSIEDMKRNGFMAAALERHGIQDASVAPLSASA